MKKISFCVAMALALVSQVKAQQTLYFGGAASWNQIQMTTADGKEVPYITTGQYAAYVLLTNESNKLSTSDYKGIKLQYENHVAAADGALMQVMAIPEGESQWGNQQHTVLEAGDKTVTVEFADVVKNKTLESLRLWAPQKGIQILLKKVWLIKNDDTEEEQTFSLLWGGWNWAKAAQANPVLTFPVQYCGQYVSENVGCDLASYSAQSNESQEYKLELTEAATNPVAILPNYLYTVQNGDKLDQKEGTFSYSICVPKGVTEYTFTLDRAKVEGWAKDCSVDNYVVDRLVFQNNEAVESPFSLKIKSLTRTSILNMPTSGFATYYTYYPIKFSDLDLEAYTVKVNDDKKTIELTKFDGVVPAGKVVLVKGTGEKSYRLTGSQEAVGTFDTDLKVSDGTITSTDAASVYGLATFDGQDGFWIAKDGNKIPAKCGYLEVAKTSQTSGAAFYSIGDINGNTTGIADVKAETMKADAQMYNLAGQMVGKGYKGIVIKNGKKMILK